MSHRAAQVQFYARMYLSFADYHHIDAERTGIYALKLRRHEVFDRVAQGF